MLAQYCRAGTTPVSDSCKGCSGDGGSGEAGSCVPVDYKACISGSWPEVHAFCGDEPWHYSRSTHFALLDQGGACQFGFYGSCTMASDAAAGACAPFCKAYPDLLSQSGRWPHASRKFRGAAGQLLHAVLVEPANNPNGADNYLSCGECFEVVRTNPDGTDLAPDAGSAPVILQVVDSCPCSANAKWCCGSGRDHCGEVSNFKYGCPLPPGDLPPDHDPEADESIHLDLGNVAMARLQTGDPNGNLVDGVIPTRYERVPCPVVGNMYVWLQPGAGPYYFGLSVVNVRNLGSIVSVEALLSSDGGDRWIALERDPNYTLARPQERTGDWVIPQGAGPVQRSADSAYHRSFGASPHRAGRDQELGA